MQKYQVDRNIHICALIPFEEDVPFFGVCNRCSNSCVSEVHLYLYCFSKLQPIIYKLQLIQILVYVSSEPMQRSKCCLIASNTKTPVMYVCRSLGALRIFLHQVPLHLLHSWKCCSRYGSCCCTLQASEAVVF